MNIANNPVMLEHLASSYALGTLRGGARRRFEAVARDSATVRAAALIWQERLSSMTELQQAAEPSPNVWKRIENLLDASRPVAMAEPADSGLLQKLRRAQLMWRSATLAVGIATLGAVMFAVRLSGTVDIQAELLSQASMQNAQMLAQLKATPDIQYVAVLADDKSAPSMLVTVDTKNQRLVLKRVGGFQEASDKSLQLWALPPAGGPQSLGVLGGDKVIRLTAAEGQVREVPALAISLEPKGGVPSAGGPTGPVLFKGALLQTTL
jgi:anti-sigma-K factor RskA